MYLADLAPLGAPGGRLGIQDNGSVNYFSVTISSSILFVQIDRDRVSAHATTARPGSLVATWLCEMTFPLAIEVQAP